MARYFATVARGLEDLAAQELEQLGGKSVRPDFTGVHFEGDRPLLYRVNLWARLPFRILMILDEFRCRHADDLYRGIQRFNWKDYLQPEQTLAVDATGGNKTLNHTHFTALQVKNAIVDQQRQQWGQRSSVDVQNPDLRVNVHIRHDRCVLSLDSSGSSLHRRGYRPAMGQAPLKESLAAALIQLSDWTPELPFLDPLCGSGTLPLEAGLKALNIAPGLFRERFGFETWQDFDAELWYSLLDDAEASEKDELPAPIVGSDRDINMLQQARINAGTCGIAHHLKFLQRDISELEAPADRGVLICNPPYGERLGDAEALGEFYKQLGDVFKQRFKGWTAYVLSGNKELSKHIGLRSAKRMSVYNGSIQCQFLKYELY